MKLGEYPNLVGRRILTNEQTVSPNAFKANVKVETASINLSSILMCGQKSNVNIVLNCSDI
ncbi:hypothetical protein BLOT_002831 [Blomia tropicalis]|nr:hypothetical protein BLOT_002831 [Blomia tropicalis]